ncbi:hypothetical protein G7K_1219-t1 [Saitoella complicata NRRL Y-17804]|uniref:Uncharacterized protein n=1 Tax=Saitoella complicata (strain BCRC 22490 / CBS 7301 / JCM 7358 / NBRC 10748 / NRRL Y-17804) TaxID=698492 RepID=A0A0E9NC71_SAICN|nr:hypothetical protein G7K_1219-t1 [Saitoella complicata NRRL Y-17804]
MVWSLFPGLTYFYFFILFCCLRITADVNLAFQPWYLSIIISRFSHHPRLPQACLRLHRILILLHQSLVLQQLINLLRLPKVMEDLSVSKANRGKLHCKTN